LAVTGLGSSGCADGGDGGGAFGGVGGMLLLVGSEVAGWVTRVGGVVATVVGVSIAVVGVCNVSRTPVNTTAAAAPTNANAAGLVRYHGVARMRNIQGATRRPPNMSSARGGA
jgi:hypothetical protein